MKKFYFLFVALSCCILHSNAQTDAKTLAYDAYSKKNWTMAETNFQQYLKTNATDTFAVYYLAMAQLKQLKYKEALNHFHELYELDLSSGIKNELRFEQAKIYATLNDTAKCFQLLEAAVKDGANYDARLKIRCLQACKTHRILPPSYKSLKKMLRLVCMMINIKSLIFLSVHGMYILAIIMKIK